MKYFIILLIVVCCFGCRENEGIIQVTATGNNDNGTVNIEYKKDGKFYSMFGITVDSLLTFIRMNPVKKIKP